MACVVATIVFGLPTLEVVALVLGVEQGVPRVRSEALAVINQVLKHWVLDSIDTSHHHILAIKRFDKRRYTHA